ncbi:hypothetical protein ACTMSW_03950 [Micromonospora sp. BQ11]|uniref:hypothetical protein n=1 Tax=Micromonospora sp. BQ11 TaxID=3452212 RepID=UPI003F8CD37A
MRDRVDSDDRRDVDRALAVAVANRVTSVIPIFIGRLDGLGHTDTFDIKQGVEMKWRELGGVPSSGDLERLVVSNLPRFRERALGSGLAGADAVAAAVDVIAALLAPSRAGEDRLPNVSSGALQVALQMDRTSLPPPLDASSWLAFELRGQAELVDRVVPSNTDVAQDLVFALRNESGAQSMTYRNAMRALLRP